MSRNLRTLSLGLSALLAACGGEDSFPVEDQCNPLGTNHCMTPWPASAFEVADDATATGRRLAIPDGTLPTNLSGRQVDPALWNQADGFSPAAPMIVSFPGGISGEGLVRQDDFDASLTDASPTIIVDMTTGERVAHFAELDAPAASTPDRQGLYLRPAKRLVGGHRYAVAIKDSLRAPGGGALPRSAGFQALLDGAPSSHPLLEAMRPRFPEVLEALEAAGVPRDQLVLAWDFTVASDEFITRDALAMRDRALAAVEATPSTFEVVTDEPVDDGTVIRRRILGTFTAPLFLTKEGRYVPDTVVARDDDGLPALQGTYDVEFTAIVPACAYDAPAPVGIMVYGHGLMGSHDQVGSGAIRETAAAACVVTIGTDMRGMSSRDLPNVASTLADLSRGEQVFEVLVQGLVNHVTLIEAARGAMAEQLFVDDAGASLVDPSKVYYYGLSQGHIFGTSVIAYAPQIQRGVIGVGGGNYSMMLERSSDWPTYKTIVQGNYPDPLDLTVLINLMQMRWDKTETAGITHLALQGEPLGVQPKQILLHMGMSDNEVPNISTHWQARTMGIPVLTPSPEQPWGLETVADEITTGSGLVIWRDEDAAVPPMENVPAPDTGAHYVTREQPASRRQIDTFFRTGVIVNECDGACECPTSCQ
jgi:hypothetical protein